MPSNMNLRFVKKRVPFLLSSVMIFPFKAKTVLSPFFQGKEAWETHLIVVSAILRSLSNTEMLFFELLEGTAELICLGFNSDIEG